MSLSCPPSAPTDAELLEQLVRLLDATLSLDRHEPPIAVGVVRVADGIDLTARPLDGRDPIGMLAGFVAPPEWSIFGVACTGRARHLDTGEGHGQAAAVHLRSRSGLRIDSLRLDGEPPVVRHRPEPVVAGSDGTGRVDDLVARALGLPTRAPGHRVSELWSRLWLDRLLAWCLEGRPPTTWELAAVAHPAVSFYEPAHRDELRWACRELDDLATLVNEWTWAEVHDWAIRDLLPADLAVDPALAAWHDVGSFSRDLLLPFLAPDAALAELAEAMPVEVLRRVEAALTRWSC